MERHLQNIGIWCIADLVGQDPEELYHKDCLKKRVSGGSLCIVCISLCRIFCGTRAAGTGEIKVVVLEG